MPRQSALKNPTGKSSTIRIKKLLLAFRVSMVLCMLAAAAPVRASLLGDTVTVLFHISGEFPENDIPVGTFAVTAGGVTFGFNDGTVDLQPNEISIAFTPAGVAGAASADQRLLFTATSNLFQSVSVQTTNGRSDHAGAILEDLADQHMLGISFGPLAIFPDDPSTFGPSQITIMFQTASAAIPEPASWGLLTFGLFVAELCRRQAERYGISRAAPREAALDLRPGRNSQRND